LSKLAGPIATLSYGIDLVQDYRTYEGNDRYNAMAATTAGFVVTAGVVGATVLLGAPVWSTVVGGAIVAVGVDYGVEKVKQTYLGSIPVMLKKGL